MLKDITKLTISGKCFPPGSDLELFTKRINIVYGRNGSGKSTISNAIRNIASGVNDGVISVKFDSALTEEEQKQIFVYDEEFTDSKIKLSHDGFDTIVMFGYQNEVQEKIDDCEKKIALLTNELDACSNELTSLSSDKNKNSSLYWRKELENALKKKGNYWSEREGVIRQSKKNWPVNEATISTLINKFFSFSTSSIITEAICITDENQSRLGDISNSIQQRIKDYRDAKSHDSIKQTIDNLIEAPNWDNISQNLANIVQEPSLSEREKFLLEKIKNKAIPDYLHESVNFFHKDGDICPFCLRSMTELDIARLSSTISNILYEEVEIFKSETRKTKDELGRIRDKIYSLADLSFIFPQEPIIKEIEFYKKCKQKLETSITDLIIKLEEKDKHPYHAIDITCIEEAKQHFSDYTNSLISIQEAIKIHNAKRSQLNALQNELICDNIDLAVYEHYSTIKNYLIKLESEKLLNKKHKELHDKINELDRIKSEYEDQLNNVNIALDRINESLKFIFFSSERLSLESKNNKYCVKSRNQNIKPEELSVGERNAISLAYFFASMHESCQVENVYKNERIVIIDDPITSFDIENRVGMLSFLHWQTEQMLKGNENSKVLFLSHDIQTIFDLSKFSANLNKDKDPEIIGEINQAVWLLQNAQLTEIQTSPNGLKFNEYRELLISIFDFANANVTLSYPSDNGVGNKMRRIAEAISTFLYSCSIEELLRKQQLFKDLNEKKKEHYRNTLFRLVFHGMSHTQEKIKGLNPSYEVFAPFEVQQIAKSFLLFIKDTHELHLSSTLKDDSKMHIISSWEKDIFLNG